MALKTILFLLLFVLSVCGVLYHPMLGILGYVAHYITGPEHQWWSAGTRHWGIRYSFALAAQSREDSGWGERMLEGKPDSSRWCNLLARLLKRIAPPRPTAVSIKPTRITDGHD